MSDYAEHQLVKCYFNNIEPEVKTGSAKISCYIDFIKIDTDIIFYPFL